jgi:3-dehydroquinate dehydratase
VKFTELSRPFIIGVVSDGEVDGCIRTIKLGEYDGADGFQLELQNFKEYPPSKQQMKDVISSTAKPVWTTNRRRRFGSSVVTSDAQSEGERIQLEMDALDAGAICIDMEMDAFDWWATWDEARRKREWVRVKDIAVDPQRFPRECCFDETAIEKQKAIIDRVHSMGAEILLSCHILVRTRAEGILRVARALEHRGADLVKIVVWNDDFYDLCDTLRANVILKEKLTVPFKLMSQGEPSKLGRALFPMFGSAWAFCQQDLRPGGFHYRPLITTEKFILQHLDWLPNWTQHKLVKERRDARTGRR